MKPNAEVLAVFAAEVERVRGIACARWGAGVMDGLTYAWDIRGATKLGLAQAGTGRIRLNATVANANPAEYRQTIAHEIAHVLAWRVFRTIGHGREWAAVMHTLGVPARVHSANPAALQMVHENRVKRGGAVASCPCGTEHVLTKAQAEKLRTLQATFSCRRCRGAIVLQTR
jgi:SprT protein